jgi:hypothetical protein
MSRHRRPRQFRGSGSVRFEKSLRARDPSSYLEPVFFNRAYLRRLLLSRRSAIGCA